MYFRGLASFPFFSCLHTVVLDLSGVETTGPERAGVESPDELAGESAKGLGAGS